MYFTDRRDAGRRLARELRHLRGEDIVVLGLPRGGVPVAAEVAAALGAPLDVIMVRKLGVPFQPELAMGAVGEDGVRVLDQDVLDTAGIGDAELAEVQGHQVAELDRRACRYRHGRMRIDLRGRTAIVVDDGLATGSSARAACQIARAAGAARVVLAVPVAPRGWTARLAGAADELVCPKTPLGFQAVGQSYRDFVQTSDEEVVACLDAAQARTRGDRRGAGTASIASGPRAGPARFADPEIWIPVGNLQLCGSLTVPDDATGVVVFAHGSGSSRHSPRNLLVADALHRAGLATFVFDLLTCHEERYRANVFDIPLLARRLNTATALVRERPEAEGLPLGYFGASTGAAAALWAAAEPDSQVATVVSRGGRPDLAAERLPAVLAPALFVVGGADEEVLQLNRRAQAQLGGPSRLAIVPSATHLFAEPGTLERVAYLATDWFTKQFTVAPHV